MMTEIYLDLILSIYLFRPYLSIYLFIYFNTWEKSVKPIGIYKLLVLF